MREQPQASPAAGPPASAFCVRGRLQSVRRALAGLRLMLADEPNARLHLVASIAVITLGAALGIDAAAWRWIALSIGWVWCAEALNTAFEHLCDAVSPELNPSVRAAKDVAAGAVLVSVAGAAALGTLTLAPFIAARFATMISVI